MRLSHRAALAQLPEHQQTLMEKSPWLHAGHCTAGTTRNVSQQSPESKSHRLVPPAEEGWLPQWGGYHAHHELYRKTPRVTFKGGLRELAALCSLTQLCFINDKNGLICKNCIPLTVFSQEEKALIMRLCCRINANSHLSYSGLKAQTQVYYKLKSILETFQLSVTSSNQKNQVMKYTGRSRMNY